MTPLHKSLLLNIVAGIIIVGALSCVRHSDAPVPRPYAYPRIALYDTIYKAIPEMPLNIEVNTGASVSDTLLNGGIRWITLNYPAYRCNVYLTLTPVADSREASSAIANRRERMALNFNTSFIRSIPVASVDSSFTGEVAVALDNSPMPVQIIGSGRGFVLSGAMHLETPDARIDSVRPIVDAISADIIHLASRLR